MLGRRMATTAMEIEMPKVSRIIHNLRRLARSRYSRTCVLMPASAEGVKVGCSFKLFLQISGCSVNKFPTLLVKQAVFQTVIQGEN
jgi:hypothetical protein